MVLTFKLGLRQLESPGEMPEEWKDLYNEAFHSFDQNGDGLPLDVRLVSQWAPLARCCPVCW